MNIKLESGRKPSPRGDAIDRTEFLETLRDMKVGQSFVWDHMSSYDRNAITFAETFLDREYATRKEGSNGSFRVHRTR